MCDRFRWMRELLSRGSSTASSRLCDRLSRPRNAIVRDGGAPTTNSVPSSSAVTCRRLLRRDDHDVFGLEFDRFVADFQSEPAVEGEVQLLLLAVVMAITGVLFFKHPDVRSHRFPLEFVPDRFPSLIEVVDAPQLEVVEADSAEKRPASTTSSRKKRQTVESAGSVAEPSNREYSRSHLPRRERTCRGLSDWSTSLRLNYVLRTQQLDLLVRVPQRPEHVVSVLAQIGHRFGRKLE